jgi:hypothetical protein
MTFTSARHISVDHRTRTLRCAHCHHAERVEGSVYAFINAAGAFMREHLHCGAPARVSEIDRLALPGNIEELDLHHQPVVTDFAAQVRQALAEEAFARKSANAIGAAL